MHEWGITTELDAIMSCQLVCVRLRYSGPTAITAVKGLGQNTEQTTGDEEGGPDFYRVENLNFV